MADHGEVTGDTVTHHYAEAAEVLDSLERLGISYPPRSPPGSSATVSRSSRPRGTNCSRASPVSWKRHSHEHPRGHRDRRSLTPSTHVPTLVQDRVASRIFAKDHTLWEPAAEDESAKRLNWTGLPRTSRHLIGEVAALREELSQAGYDRVVLCGMGGSSLAPEVICATAGVPIDVLDSSDPDVVRAALTDLDRTVVVVSSKCRSAVVGNRLALPSSKAFHGMNWANGAWSSSWPTAHRRPRRLSGWSTPTPRSVDATRP